MTKGEMARVDRKECPYYSGVCGLDESCLCYRSSDYKNCDIYKENKAYEEITDDGEW